jgi:hypothetical protein
MSNWIDINGHKPQSGERVLIYVANVSITATYYNLGFGIDNFGSYEYKVLKNLGFKATHWQPLPEPPITDNQNRKEYRDGKGY